MGRPSRLVAIAVALNVAACSGGAQTGNDSGISGNDSGIGGSDSGIGDDSGSGLEGGGSDGGTANHCPAGQSQLTATMSPTGYFLNQGPGDGTLAPLIGRSFTLTACLGPFTRDSTASGGTFTSSLQGSAAGTITFGGPDVGVLPSSMVAALASPRQATVDMSFNNASYTLPWANFSIDANSLDQAAGKVWSIHFECVTTTHDPIDPNNVTLVGVACDSSVLPVNRRMWFRVDNTTGTGTIVVSGLPTFTFSP